jgi:galactoside O-acetyltransferase
MINSFYSAEELKQLGFQSFGKDVLISRKASIYGAQNMIIGNHVRIDDFCILSGKITIGNHVHIAAYVGLFAGSAGIVAEDFVGISSRTAVYATSDDYSGSAMTNPTIPDEYRNVVGEQVTFGKHSLIGTGCTVLPGACIGEGTSVGSMSLVSKPLAPWGIYVGIPCKLVKERSKRLLEMEQQLASTESVHGGKKH